MTYKRNVSQKRVKKIQKALSLRWRQQEDEEAGTRQSGGDGDDQFPHSPQPFLKGGPDALSYSRKYSSYKEHCVKISCQSKQYRGKGTEKSVSNL